MKRYMNFYHLVVEVYSAKSGDSIVVFDDYYTPQIAGSYEGFEKMVKSEISCANATAEVRLNSGEFKYALTTCCFNNGTGRSSKSQTNIQPYSVKENVEQMTMLSYDQTFNQAILEGVEWVKKQQPPF